MDSSYIEKIHSTTFPTYEDAIAAYGHDIIRVALSPPPAVRPLPCNLAEDMVVAKPPIRPRQTLIEFELRQFLVDEPSKPPVYFWRYVRR